MLSSLTALVAVTALALVPSVQAQLERCGGLVLTNGAFNTFTVQNPASNITVVTVSGLGGDAVNSESYVLYCSDEAPDVLALTALGIPPNLSKFKVPVTKVAVAGTYTSSYIELIGQGSTIKLLENPKNVVSPCLQASVANGSTVALDKGNFSQYDSIDVGFAPLQNTAQTKDVWIPMADYVDPLLKIEYIRLVSLFFNQHQKGQEVSDAIRNSYNVMAADMSNIPAANKKRIAWIKYDFNRASWVIRSNPFTKAIITNAGGIPFPLKGEVNDDQSVSVEDIKTLFLNAQLVIDETDFPKTPVTWRSLTGFAPTDKVPVFDQKQVYSLTKTTNAEGVSGGGIYGGDGSNSGQGGGSKTGIIVAVVCVAAILGAGFAFAFFKWSKRAKEDRFIELEEEMNNEIPLH
ncbi:hypothetical protein BGZ68_007183 [Mortierella alpina]|nr:hypothetical protein BGZ68_007183 [Mortierella alpina]